MEYVTVRPLTLDPDRRVLVLSDVHGNRDFFWSLLKALDFSPEDELILLGDLLEKGEESLTLLREVMALSQTHRVHMLCGNCDNLTYNFADENPDIPQAFYESYIFKWGKKCILRQMADELGLPLRSPADFPDLRAAIRAAYAPELAFLRDLPTVLLTDDFLFVHGGVSREDRLEELPAWPCMKNDDFLPKGYSFRRWVVVGHWPVTLYHLDIPCAAPILLPERHILSIDGGCQLKWDGQLNALILPAGNHTDFHYAAWDGLPRVVALDGQAPSTNSINIRWSENPVEVLERGEEFCRCRHIATGRVLDILTEYLYEQGGVLRCEDSTDYLLPVSPGDTLAVVRETSRGILAKRNGVTGWYTGRIARTGAEKPALVQKIPPFYGKIIDKRTPH